LQVLLLSNVIISKPPTISLPIGTNGNYTITVNNTGDAPAPNVTVVEVLPPGLQFVSGPPGCSATGQTVTCIVGPMPPGGGADIPLVVKPVAPGTFDTIATAGTNTANSTIDVVRTCAVYNGDGSSFACTSLTAFNANNSQSTSPSAEVCCVSG
jgi:uncharacterized repeat protein (TIGR01451 family)